MARYYPEDTSYWLRIPKVQIFFNPFVLCLSLLTIVTLLSSVILLDNLVPAELGQWFDWVHGTWTWFYISSRDAMIIFVIYVFFSRFSDLKLSADEDEKPEFSTLTWFMMAFTCGASLQLFYFSVSDPVTHYDPTDGSNRYIADAFSPDNTLAQQAMNLTFYHWGLHAWVVFCLFGLVMSVMTHREGLPLSFKSCFYPMIGDTIFSWIGDVLDSLCIVIIVINLSFHLSYAVNQLNFGINFLIYEIPVEKWVQNLTIWLIVIPAEIMLHYEFKKVLSKFSMIAFTSLTCLATLVFMLEDSWYLLNLFVQSVGYYLNWIIQLGTHTDTFEQYSVSFGAQNARGRSGADGSSDGPTDWLKGYTISSWSWWLAWGPFVGVFLARISRGRTIREFLLGTLIAPVIIIFTWITIFGGAAIGSERLAHSQSFCCDQNWDSAAVFDDTTVTTLDALAFTTANAAPLCIGDTCSTCADATLQKFIDKGYTLAEFIDDLQGTLRNGWEKGDYTFVQNFKGRSPVNSKRDVVLLSCVTTDQRLFWLLRSYFEVGDVLHGLALFTILLFAITNFAFVGYVLNVLASNGSSNPSKHMMGAWLTVIGLTSTAIIYVGGEYTLSDISIVSYLLAFPLSIPAFSLIFSLYRALLITSGEKSLDHAYWRVGFFDFCTTLNKDVIVGWLRNIATGPYNSCKAYGIVRQIDHRLSILVAVFLYVMLFCLVLLNPLRYFVNGLWAFGWLCYLAFAAILAIQRHKIRNHLGYSGNAFEDFFACLFCYPSVGHQIEMELQNGLAPGESHERVKKRDSNRVHPVQQTQRRQPQPQRSPTPPPRQPPREPAQQPRQRAAGAVELEKEEAPGVWGNYV